MKKMFFIFILFFCNSSFAQTYFFNKTYKPDSINILSPACLTVDDGYLFAGPYGSYNTLQNSFYIRKTDLYGETKWFKAFETGNHSIFSIGGGILTKANNNTYILVGSRTYEDDELNQDVVMINFTENGEHLWTKIITEPNGVEYPYHISPTQDGGYILCGIQRSFTSNNHFYILKTDALGNKIWDKVLHEDKKGAAFTIHELSNQTGYIVSGYLYKEGSNIDADMYVACLDSNGLLKWEKSYHDTPESDVAAQITPFNNNNYLLTGGFQQNNIYHLYLSLIDTLGTIIWEKEYLVNDVLGFQARNIIDNKNNIINIASYVTNENKDAPLLIAFDAQGDTLWTRKIPDTPLNDNTYLKDIALAVDGGYILSGFNYSTQSSWVVKTDSLGHTCSTMGCDSLAFATSVEELVLENSSFKISPNPSQDVVQFSWKNNSFFIHENYEIRVFDAFGILLKREKTNNTNATLNVSNLKKGIYFCQLFEGKELLGTQKMMVLR